MSKYLNLELPTLIPMAQLILMHRYETLPSERAYNVDYVTHIAYFHDLLSYTTRQCDIEWSIPELTEIQSYKECKRFEPVVGDCVLKFRQIHFQELETELNFAFQIYGKAWSSVDRILSLFANSSLKEGKFLKEFLKFSALVVHFALYYTRRQEIFGLKYIVECLEIIYTSFLRHRMLMLGGWNEFKTYAMKKLAYDK